MLEWSSDPYEYVVSKAATTLDSRIGSFISDIFLENACRVSGTFGTGSILDIKCLMEGNILFFSTTQSRSASK